jgi:hypothetical protein
MDTIVRDHGLETIRKSAKVLKPNEYSLRVSVAEQSDNPSLDAFGRMRVSEPFTLFDSKQLHDKQPLFWDEVVASNATSVHSDEDACVNMTITANASDYVIRQTKQRFNYQPAKSQLVFMTFYSPSVTGVVKRIGMFDGTGLNKLTPNNGIFFESNNEASWNIAKNGVITQRITQANWNVDKLDGTGNSGITLNLNATQILIIDYEWLGVGRVRVGFVINGAIYYCHYFNHSNNAAFTSVYASTPNLPLRYCIQTDGTNAGSMCHICSSVISEGGLDKTGILRSISTTAPLTGLGTGTTYAILGIRLKELYQDVSVIAENISLLSTTNSNFQWQVLLNPTVAGTFTFLDVADSAVQSVTGTSANTISAKGLIIAGGFASNDLRSTREDLQTALRIGSTIAGVQDRLVLSVTPITNNTTIHGSLGIRELL